jgi:hypothetical protein
LTSLFGFTTVRIGRGYPKSKGCADFFAFKISTDRLGRLMLQRFGSQVVRVSRTRKTCMKGWMMSLDMSPYRTAPGAIALLSAPQSVPLGIFREALQNRLDTLRAGFGNGVQLRLSVRFDEDPLRAVYGDRAMAPTDAIFDMALLDGRSPSELASLMGALSDLLDCVDFGASAIVVGTFCYIHEYQPAGSEVFTFLGRKAGGISHDEMRRWWLVDHAELILRLQNGIARPWSYAQLHVDHRASRLASTMAGIAAAEYDMATMVTISDRQKFFDFHCESKVARALAEDETGHLDPESWQGGLVQALRPSVG